MEEGALCGKLEMERTLIRRVLGYDLVLNKKEGMAEHS